MNVTDKHAYASLIFNEYQEFTADMAVYDYPVLYTALKLCGEAGEVAEKIGKGLRDGGATVVEYTGGRVFTELTPELTDEVIKELGDVLWYVAALANDLGVDLSTVARMNIEKLSSRKERGVIGGSGDDR